MSRTIFTSVFMAATNAHMTRNRRMPLDNDRVLYPDEENVDDFRIDPSEYPMVFMWPEDGFRCGATMISP